MKSVIMIKKLRRAALPIAGALGLALTLAGLAPASAASQSSAGPYHAGWCSAHGDFADCVAEGTAYRPKVIEVRTYATPNQRVTVFWDMVCSQGVGAGSSSGHFSGRTSLIRKLRQPYRQPDNCSVAASAELDNGGHYILVKIIYWK
jgi:hypothetical protein